MKDVKIGLKMQYEDNLKIEDLNRMVQEAGFKSLGAKNDKKENKKHNTQKMPNMDSLINGKVYFAGNKKLLEEKQIKNIYEEKELEYSKKGESIVYLFNENELLAIVGLADEIKENMKEVTDQIKSNGYETVMLTGDNEVTARNIAEELGIKEIVSNVSPKEK